MVVDIFLGDDGEWMEVSDTNDTSRLTIEADFPRNEEERKEIINKLHKAADRLGMDLSHIRG